MSADTAATARKVLEAYGIDPDTSIGSLLLEHATERQALREEPARRVVDALEAFVVAVVEDLAPGSDAVEFLARADARDALLDALGGLS